MSARGLVMGCRSPLAGPPAHTLRVSRPCLSRAVPRSRLQGSRPGPQLAVRASKGDTPDDIPEYFRTEATKPVTQEQQYQSVSPTYRPAPGPQSSAGSQIPPLVWVGVGVVVATLVKPVLNFFTGGPAKLQQLAMEQAMKQMMKQAGNGQGASPFGPAGSPLGAGPASPFGAGAGGMPAGFPSFPTMPPTPAPAAPKTVDTTATTSQTASTATPPAPATSDAPAPKRAAFVDVTPSAAAGREVDSSEISDLRPGAETGAVPSGSAGAEAGAAAGQGPSSSAGAGPSGESVVDMLRNPEMQKTLYPYLPEHMRNPQTFEFMLSNPESRAQLEQMMSQQMEVAGTPEMKDMMASMDSEKMSKQFDALGMTPEQMMQKVMSDPELATMMTKPNVMTALMEMNKNPMAMFKYQSDPEVSKVFEKLSGLFPQAAGAKFD
ncbi:hypothetical protein ACKKBG_A11515 [Auxenochlorella protothecoides x Auxenochlorella symbiontica]